MKKTVIVILLAIFVFTSLTVNQAKADPYGKVTISGIAKAGSSFVVLASAFEGGETSGCALNDWWLPGTNYAFWLPLTGNEDLYKDLMTAYVTGKKIWIDTTYESFAFAAGVHCRIRIDDKPVVISDFQ